MSITTSIPRTASPSATFTIRGTPSNPTPSGLVLRFPPCRQYFNGPGVSVIARMTSNISPTLLNEFVASYTTDHISFKSVGYFAYPSNGWEWVSLPNNGVGKLPAINIVRVLLMGRLLRGSERHRPEGPYNSNPTYTYRDNMTKIIGRHNLTFGAYFVAGQKNELSSVK